jgi:hypothetical protein
MSRRTVPAVAVTLALAGVGGSVLSVPTIGYDQHLDMLPAAVRQEIVVRLASVPVFSPNVGLNPR